jgi:polyisoprenyl-teichoic acid--peptidoglycan teichoic acid transferase
MMRAMARDPKTPAPPPEASASTDRARPGRRTRSWARAARWGLYGVAAIFMLLVLAAVGIVASSKTPLRAALGWPYALKQRTNVLIMGLDRTVSDKNPNIVYPESRTDTLIAASFDPQSRRVYLLSIPRDTRANVPGHGTTKINAAHAWGEVPLTIRTTENFLGVRFPYYIEIRERGFVHMIDAVGGVNVHVEKDMNYDDNWDGLHIHLKQGYRRLGGKAAIEYARFRHDPLGDIGRVKRQQEVMSALLDELRQPRIALHLNRLLRVFREDINTNLTREQLITLGLFGARLPSGGLIRETLPGRFGNEWWLPDLPQDRKTVARMFYGLDADALARTTVEMIVDPASRDAAADVQARLAALGMRIVRVRSASTSVSATANSRPTPVTVTVRRGDPRIAGIVASLLGGAPVVDGASADGPDLTIQLANAVVGGPTIALPR